MLRPHRFDEEIDPGPVQIGARKVPLVKDPHLAEDMRGFIGQEAMHADIHERVLHEYMVVNGVDPNPILDGVEFVFEKTLAPTTFTDPKRRLNHLCDRLWLIAVIKHYTAVMGDFALNCAWDDHGASPTMVDLFRWHGSEEVERFSPEEMGSTAQAVAYLASSPARAAHF